MGLTRISSLVWGGWEIEQPSPEYFLLPVQVPISEFLQVFFSKVVWDSPMVLSSRSRCMVLTMVGQFDHLLPTLRLICGVLGRKSIPWLPVLTSRRAVHKRLVLDQIQILWKVKCSGEGGNGLTLREFWSFEPLISTLLSGGMGLFFSLLLLQFFFKKMTHTPWG